MGVFCDIFKFGSTAALNCSTGQNKGRYRKKELFLLLLVLLQLTIQPQKKFFKAANSTALHHCALALVHCADRGAEVLSLKVLFCREELPEKFYGDMSINIGNSRVLLFCKLVTY